MVNKIILLTVSILVLVGCTGRSFQKEQEDSIRIADSIANVEAERKATLRQARLDSIAAENDKLQEALNQMLEILSNSKNRAIRKHGKFLKETGYLSRINYFTTDCNEDGIPELWIIGPGGIIGECSPVEVFHLNEEGKVEQIGDFCIDGGFSIKNGTVYSLSMFGTDESAPWCLEKYSIKNNKVVTSIIEEGVDDAEDPDYKPMPSFRYVKTHPISDSSNLVASFKLVAP